MFWTISWKGMLLSWNVSRLNCLTSHYSWQTGVRTGDGEVLDVRVPVPAAHQVPKHLVPGCSGILGPIFLQFLLKDMIHSTSDQHQNNQLPSTKTAWKMHDFNKKWCLASLVLCMSHCINSQHSILSLWNCNHELYRSSFTTWITSDWIISNTKSFRANWP